MKLTVAHETARLNRVLREVHPALRRSMKTLVKDGAKLALRKGIEMTPPGESNMGAQEAKKRGENAILTDAFGGRRGSKGQTKRSGIFFVANEGLLRKWHAQNPGGDTERLFVKKDGTVWATEKRFYQPNADLGTMNAHHARYWKNGRMSSGGTRDRTIGRHVFIDRMVIGKGAQRSFLAARYKRVGFLAAGWLDAAGKLKMGRLPAWIKRHQGAPGDFREKEGSSTYTVHMINSVKFGGAAQLNRIVPYALAAASAGMKAQAKHVMLKGMKSAGFTLTATSLTV
jgi:hypothetical protein